MISDKFYFLTALATFNSFVQAQLRQVASPESIVAIAAEYGFAITLQQLNFFSTRSSSYHCIWADKGEAWHENFFSGKRQLEPLTA